MENTFNTNDYSNKSLSTVVRICNRKDEEIEKLKNTISNLRSKQITLANSSVNSFFETFSKEKLEKIENDDVWEYTDLVKLIFAEKQKINSWFEPIANSIENSGLLTQSQKQNLLNIKKTNNQHKYIIDNFILELKNENQLLINIENSLKELKEKEDELLTLIESENSLKEKEIKLENLKILIKNNGLIELKNKVDELSSSLTNEELELDKLTSENNELLQRKKLLETELNSNLSKKSFLKNVPTLIEELELKISKFNKENLKESEDLINELRIRIDFTKITSSDLLNEKGINDLEGIENQLNFIDDVLKKSI